MRLFFSLEVSRNTGFVYVVVLTQQGQVVHKEFSCCLSDVVALIAMGCVGHFSHVISMNMKLTLRTILSTGKV